MSGQHGASTIKRWMDDLLTLARDGSAFQTSAGADPGRDYAYLEFHLPDGQHSVLLFRVEAEGDANRVRAYRFDGDDTEIRDRVHALVHPAD